MAEQLSSTKLNPESHLLLDQPLLRTPYEVSRRNFKTAQKLVEQQKEGILSSLKTTANDSNKGQDPNQTLASLDSMIDRMQGLKRRLDDLHGAEEKINEHSRKRIQHLKNLYDIPSLADVKYEQWSRIRLDRLLVDYLLRCGYVESARSLAMEKGIEELVDLDVFLECHMIEDRLRGGKVDKCLQWCLDNRQALKKINSSLEFELRIQQYIEFKRSEKVVQARQHAQRYLMEKIDARQPDAKRAAGIMAYSATKSDPYNMFSQARWKALADLFVKTHHELLSLPPLPLLHTALSAGLSALKTPSCHSKRISSTANAKSSTTSVCPICSMELNELAKQLPYAHHTKSHVENDPVVLPTLNLYGRDRLLEMSTQFGLDHGNVKDPVTGDVFPSSQIRKVYIS